MGVSLLSKTHPQFMEHSNGSVMHTSTHAGLFPVLFLQICPFLIQRIFSFTCLHSFFTCIQQITCTCFFKDYISNFISSFTYTCPIKYTSKKGLELMRLLTVELCSIKKCVLHGLYRSVLCNINAGSFTLLRHCMME